MQTLLLATAAPWRQSPKFVFATFFDRSLSPLTVPSNACVADILLAPG